MLSLNGTPPAKAQMQLKETLQLQNYFLACGCIPHRDMEIALSQEALTYQVEAKVLAVNTLSPVVMELELQCNTPIDYHGGQSVLLLNYEQVGKYFSIASPTSAKSNGQFEVHVELIPRGPFSEWMHKKLRVGDKLIVSGVRGELIYNAEARQQALLMVGWNGGLGALIGLVQDAFENDHTGNVILCHSVNDLDHLYFVDELREIGDYYPNFKYIPCIESDTAPEGFHRGPVTQVITELTGSLNNWKVYLCGNREQVHKVQRSCYLAGARMQDIYLEVLST